MQLTPPQQKAAHALIDAAKEEPGSPRDWLSGRADRNMGLDWSDPYHPKSTAGVTHKDIEVAFRHLVKTGEFVKGPPSKTFGDYYKGQGYARINPERFGWYWKESIQQSERLARRD